MRGKTEIQGRLGRGCGQRARAGIGTRGLWCAEGGGLRTWKTETPREKRRSRSVALTTIDSHCSSAASSPRWRKASTVERCRRMMASLSVHVCQPLRRHSPLHSVSARRSRRCPSTAFCAKSAHVESAWRMLLCRIAKNTPLARLVAVRRSKAVSCHVSSPRYLGIRATSDQLCEGTGRGGGKAAGCGGAARHGCGRWGTSRGVGRLSQVAVPHRAKDFDGVSLVLALLVGHVLPRHHSAVQMEIAQRGDDLGRSLTVEASPRGNVLPL